MLIGVAPGGGGGVVGETPVGVRAGVLLLLLCWLGGVVCSHTNTLDVIASVIGRVQLH